MTPLSPRHLCLMTLFAALLAVPATAAERAVPVTTAAGAGTATSIAGWAIQSSAKVQEGGKAISSEGYPTDDWSPVDAHSTVMAGLVENGLYPAIFHGDALRAVKRELFAAPWWYRTTFQLSDANGPRTFLKIKGIIPRADVWLNGVRVADHETITGAFTVHALDVTGTVHAGANTLAIKVYPANPQRDLSIGWIDWNPAPPDNNMGIWRDVRIVRSGSVSLHHVRVESDLAPPELDHAALTVKAEIRNDSDAARDVTISGKIAGIAVERNMHLAAHQSRGVTFDSETDSGLALDDPRIWWPAGLGNQPLYHLTLVAKTGGALSDRATETFGIRDVRSHLTEDGYRQFVINGEPLLIRGGGWAPDMFLRDDPQRLERAFRHTLNLGLNTIRLEGRLAREDFYERADREGILVIAGWECCSKWEAWARTGGEPWDAKDRRVAAASMLSEARLLRDHPSVIAFLIGSDNAPPPKVARAYVDALHAADWPNPIIATAADAATAPTGPSGMKMSGPYGWVPPNYWYAHRRGAAFGFNSETSAGIDIPNLDSLQTMLSTDALEDLWQDYDAWQYHAAPGWSTFATLERFDTALAHRYGTPTSLADYVAKAQLANYANVRAQFEAYGARMDADRPATGVIYWMLNSAWPSLHWHLFTDGLEPAGAYYGAQKANEPLHIQYDYGNQGITLVNHTGQNATGLTARVRVRDLDGRVRHDRRLRDVGVPANSTARLLTLPTLDDLSSVYFVELALTRDGHAVSRNVYWLSTRPDVLDWDNSTWYMTPVSRYADLTALQTLPDVAVDVRAATRRQGATAMTAVTLANPADAAAVALFGHLSIRRGDNGEAVLPVYWSGNDVTLWPGESLTLTARYPAEVLDDAAPAVHVGGWNIKPRRIPASAD